MKCQKCGYSLPEDSEFCQYCGTRLELQSTPDIVATPMEAITTENLVCGIKSESTPTVPKSKTDQEESLVSREYSSYISANPDKKRFFEEMLGTEELKAAYLEECAKNKREYDKSARINFNQSYTQCMGVVHDEYVGIPDAVVAPNPASRKNQKEIPTVSTKTSRKKNKRRYCKRCGQPIDNTTKKCTGCGKRYFKAKFMTLYALLIIILLVVGYVGVNYSFAVSAMNDMEFFKAKRFFDKTFVSETLFPAQYSYAEAGVLMEAGKYVESLNAFEKIDEIPVSPIITDYLKSKIYSIGQSEYRAGNITASKKYFDAVGIYQRSEDYLLLISCGGGSIQKELVAKINYDKLIKLLGFENTDEIILQYESTALLFLKGRWEDGDADPYYFELNEDSEGFYSRYNIPSKDDDGYFYISDAIYSVGETESSAVKNYKFSIIDEDTISIYCYKDGSTHKLYRQ